MTPWISVNQCRKQCRKLEMSYMKVTWVYGGMRKYEQNFVQKLAIDSGEKRKSSNSIQRNDDKIFSPGDPHIGKIGQFSPKWLISKVVMHHFTCIYYRKIFWKLFFLTMPNHVIICEKKIDDAPIRHMHIANFVIYFKIQNFQFFLRNWKKSKKMFIMHA